MNPRTQNTKTSWLLAVLLVGMAGISSPLTAEEPAGQVLRLDEAIELALDANRALRASDARREAAAAGVDEARAHRRPAVGLDATVQRTNHPVLVFSHRLGQSAFRAQDFALDALNDPDPLSNWQGRITVEQPLWTGGRLRLGLETAELGHDAAELEHDATRQRVIHRVVEAYTGAVLADREVLVTREALATATAHVELVRNLHEGGLVVASDPLQAEVRESEVRELVIRAESRAAIARAALNQVLGRDLDAPLALPEDLEPPDAAESLDEATLVERAKQQRPDLEAARTQRQASERLTRLERADKLPEIGLGAGYEANAHDFFGADGTSWTLTVGAHLDLFDAGRKARIRRAEARTREAEELAEGMAQRVALEVRQAFHELRAAHQRLDQGRRRVELARRSLEIVTDRYREGLTILPELLDAETALTRARLHHLAAGRDVRLARVTLDLATGDL